MKTKARILAALSALTLFQCCTQLFTVSAAVPSVTAEVFQENVSADEQEAAAVIKEAIMNRTENFSVVTPKNGFTKEEIGGHLIYLACEETGKGNEGDYLRYSIKSYLCGIRTTESEYMINFTIEYGTTAEEEAALTEKISEIKDPYHIQVCSRKYQVFRKHKGSLCLYSLQRRVQRPRGMPGHNSAPIPPL